MQECKKSRLSCLKDFVTICVNWRLKGKIAEVAEDTEK